MLRRFFNTKPAAFKKPTTLSSPNIFKFRYATLVNNRFPFKKNAILNSLLNPPQSPLLVSNDFTKFTSCKRFIATNEFNREALNSLLVDAIKSENLEMMRRFLRKGADPNLIEMPNTDKHLLGSQPAVTPLLYLCHQLYNRKDNTSAQSENLRHMIFELIRYSFPNTLNRAENNRDYFGRRPLHLASIFGDEGIIFALLRCGADPNLTVIHGGVNSCDLYLKNTDEINQELVNEYEKCMIKCKEEELSKQGTVKQNSEQAETRASKKA